MFPEIAPFRTGTLGVSNIHRMFYEEAGNPEGSPALFLHGGPGVGILPEYRRFFDPEVYRIILPDQRGAGKSTPHAELKENTTWDLVEDLEKLRSHLDIETWLVMGGSWGSTLALCYAVTYPESVLGLILRGVFLARPSEIRWLHQSGGASQIFPDEWARYVALLPPDKRDHPVKEYYGLLTGKDEVTKREAAKAWTRWEAATMTLVPDQNTLSTLTQDASAIAIGRIECHYTFNGFFMKSDNFLMEHVNRIQQLPCRIVQGRYDIICPMISAWELHRALPWSELRIVPDGAHSPLEPGMIHELIQATEDFKELY